MLMRTYNSSELARQFGVSYPTFKKWLSGISELGNTNGRRVFTPKELDIIFKVLGVPSFPSRVGKSKINSN